MTTVTGKVVKTKYAGTSVNGNPAYMVTIRDKDGCESTWRTSTDVGLAYGIENPEYREHTHEYGLTVAGRIRTATRVEEASE